jgi:hypothetical protein
MNDEYIKVLIHGTQPTQGRALMVYFRRRKVNAWAVVATSQIRSQGKEFIEIPKWLADKEGMTRRSL